MQAEQGQPLVSVVIPAYNAENTLQQILDCVLHQTWKNLQVVLVDDGSKDGTLKLARSIARQDARLTVVDGGEKGVSASRNTALSLCRGKYIRFADADDTMPSDSIEKMVRRAEADGSDLVIGGYDQYFGEKHTFHNLAGRDDSVPCDEMMDHLCSHANSYFYGVLWNKLFVREKAEAAGCRFRENLTWGEDFAFVMDYLGTVGRVSFMKDSLYDYRRSAGSTSFKQVLDCVKRPMYNIRVKRELYGHLKGMYVKRGIFPRYRRKLWHYLFRVGLG